MEPGRRREIQWPPSAESVKAAIAPIYVARARTTQRVSKPSVDLANVPEGERQVLLLLLARLALQEALVGRVDTSTR